MLLSLYFVYKVLYANGADPDQTPRSAASDLALHCLHISRKWISGRKRVK